MIRLEVVRAGDREILEIDPSAPIDRLRALAPCIAFGAFELGPASAGALAVLERARARPSRAWWASLTDDDLARAEPIGEATYGRGLLALCEGRVLVLHPCGRTYACAATVGAIRGLANDPSVALANAIDHDDPRPVINELLREPWRVPDRCDARSDRGVAGMIAAIARSEEEADALLPEYLESDDPCLALAGLRAALGADEPSSAYARQIERMGARYGERWARLRRYPSPAPTIADPIAALAGMAADGPGTVVAPWEHPWAPLAQPRETLERWLAAWRAADPPVAERIADGLRALSRDDVYFAFHVLAHRPRVPALAPATIADDTLHRILGAPPLWPIVAASFADIALSSSAMEIAASSDSTRLVPVIDSLLTRRRGPGWRDFDSEVLAAARLRIAPLSSAEVERLAQDVQRGLAAPASPESVSLEGALALLAAADPVAFARACERHITLVASEIVAVPALVDVLRRARAARLLVAIAKLRGAATDEKLLAAEATVELGDAGARDLAAKLRARLDRELDRL